MYQPMIDLAEVQRIMRNDPTILSLLDLTGKPQTDVVKQVIKRSKWDDLTTNEKRLCISFVPARRTGNECFFEEVLQIDCHTPVAHDFKAWQVQEQVFKLLHKQKVNNRYLYAEPPLGELPTMQGFFCCGTRFRFYRSI